MEEHCYGSWIQRTMNVLVSLIWLPAVGAGEETSLAFWQKFSFSFCSPRYFLLLLPPCRLWMDGVYVLFITLLSPVCSLPKWF